MTKNLKNQFLLDKNIVFLNHGSFGATPKEVFEIYQSWQLRLENQPVLFLGREFDQLMRDSRVELGHYVNCDPDDIAYIPNATYGVNNVARSITLKEGDEVLTTNHEYGACDFTWDFLCKKVGAKYVHQPISLPVTSDIDICEQLFQGINERTRVIFLSHITSPTALKFPVKEICLRARQLGILSVVDGAHALGQVEFSLEHIGADFYTSNCHKWSLAPKGAAFLYARKSVQHLIEPLVVSWGFGNDPKFGSGSQFIDYLQWTGTKDPAAALTVPAAIDFMAKHHWEDVRKECHLLLRESIERINNITQLQPIYPLDSDFYIQMGVAVLPPSTDLVVLKKRLYDEFKVEVPLTQLGKMKFMRISFQAYNSRDDLEILISALEKILHEVI